MGPPALKEGQNVRVLQRIERREGEWRREVEGTLVSVKAEPTGSWFAHGKDDKLWLQRVVLRKPDGELTTLIIDRFTEVEVREG